MKVLGLIVEYNPFHNGHAYHLEEAVKLSGADYVVCVMSGNFIQRGEPAIVNKWARTQMALEAGVDLVIELPLVYAMGSAEYFAFGAVKLLDSLGVTDYLCFGSEHGSIEALESIADILINEPPAYQEILKAQMNTGISYPSAREKALTEYCKTMDLPAEIENIIGSSNNILGIEYLKALKKLSSRITPLTIQRVSNDYHTREITGSISSATAIRNHIKNNDSSDFAFKQLKETLPTSIANILEKEFEAGRGPVFQDHFEAQIFVTLRKSPVSEIASLCYVAEGLENRLRKASEQSGTLEALIESVTTKRYPRTRVQRILFNALLGITTDEFNTFNSFGGPQYIRVLGFNHRASSLMSQINKKASLPVIMKVADFKHSCNPLLKRMLEIESLATNIYVLAYKNPEFRKAGQEFTQNIIRMKPSSSG
ncbi:MAG: nucleotidyltransferase [Clostridia bacterium]|nr:nucleotidyltransferase [Clostridia bacterium]